MVVIIPAGFALFTRLGYFLSLLSGVAFPFAQMFGALFLIVFVFKHSITARLHKFERQNWALIREQSLLALELRMKEKQIRSLISA